eukprot:TRINITY_DN16179_c0_g1_i1.p1 TRINITY_DN16179_c0_g1~~TRINITY_DN16179_c0_g1_i1.p1  ORF type:complete len:206 (+),score=51.03 TRINITY_DN16179_c0_g1_i1:83-700(+)
MFHFDLRAFHAEFEAFKEDLRRETRQDLLQIYRDLKSELREELRLDRIIMKEDLRIELRKDLHSLESVLKEDIRDVRKMYKGLEKIAQKPIDLMQIQLDALQSMVDGMRIGLDEKLSMDDFTSYLEASTAPSFSVVVEEASTGDECPEVRRKDSTCDESSEALKEDSTSDELPEAPPSPKIRSLAMPRRRKLTFTKNAEAALKKA